MMKVTKSPLTPSPPKNEQKTGVLPLLSEHVYTAKMQYARDNVR